jgi:galactose mutarotase-like enzyme
MKDNHYKIDDNTYQAPMHGFARDYEYKVVKQSETSITFIFSSNEQTVKMYPYQFRLYTKYELDNNKLHCSFEVENCNDYEMLFSLGYHTGLMCPLDNTKVIEDYSLIFEKKETPVEILCNEEGLLSGEQRVYFENKDTIKLHNKLFKASFILSQLKSDYVSIVENTTGRYVKVSIKDVPYVVFWSTPDNVKFICIEPWYGLPDDCNTDGQFAKKPGIQSINAGECFTCIQTIEIGKQRKDGLNGTEYIS